MKTEEIILNGEKISIVVDFDDDYIEQGDIDNMNDTTDLSNIIEVAKEELNEQ